MTHSPLPVSKMTQVGVSVGLSASPGIATATSTKVGKPTTTPQRESSSTDTVALLAMLLLMPRVSLAQEYGLLAIHWVY